MFKSWSVGKPQILVQVSVEKNPPKKQQHYLSKKKWPTSFTYLQMKNTLHVYIDTCIVNWNNNYNNPEQ